MAAINLDVELQAAQALVALYEQAKRCKQLYESAGLVIPEPLQRFLGIGTVTENGAKSLRSPATKGFITPPIDPEARPVEAEDWIYLPIQDAAPQSIALAYLRAAAKPVRHKDLVSYITNLLPNVPSGSISNIGTRMFAEGILASTEEGWIINDPARGGILGREVIWGPPSIFSSQEVAAHRRHAILHVLRQFPGGLQVVQIVEQLKSASWVKAPVNKDALKTDIKVLVSGGKIRQRGNSRKWELVPE